MEIKDEMYSDKGNVFPLLTVYAPSEDIKCKQIDCAIVYHKATTSMPEIEMALSVVICSVAFQISKQAGKSYEEVEAEMLDRIKEKVAYNRHIRHENT